MMTGPRHNEEGRLLPLPDLVPDPHDHSFIVKMTMTMRIIKMMTMTIKMTMKARDAMTSEHSFLANKNLAEKS